MLARRAAALGAVLGLAIGVAACSAPDERIAPAPVARAVAAVESPPPSPPPPSGPRALAAPSALIELRVEGHLPALAMVPIGATDRRPVAVVTHGNWGGPQWDCPLWRGILGGGVFILCPRGTPRPDQQPPPSTPSETAYTYESAKALEAEIDAGLAALRIGLRRLHG
ncbi:MAG: hypothetical protein QM820_31275 [Minicystis sp.]